jgi:hypothetical protein
VEVAGVAAQSAGTPARCAAGAPVVVAAAWRGEDAGARPRSGSDATKPAEGLPISAADADVLMLLLLPARLCFLLGTLSDLGLKQDQQRVCTPPEIAKIN